MKTTTEKTFDTVKFFRAIKEKLAAKMAGITLEQQKKFLRQVREGKLKLHDKELPATTGGFC